MDVFDRASELEQADQQRMIDRHRQRVQLPPVVIDGVPCCRDCEEPIADRLAVNPQACRCLECQQRQELRDRHYAR